MVVLKFIRSQWDRTTAVLSAVVGLVLLIDGWVGVSGTGYLAKQLPYLASDGLIGLFFVAVAAVLWISADLRDEWRQLRYTNLAIRDAQTLWLEKAAADEARAAVELIAASAGARSRTRSRSAAK